MLSTKNYGKKLSRAYIYHRALRVLPSLFEHSKFFLLIFNLSFSHLISIWLKRWCIYFYLHLLTFLSWIVFHYCGIGMATCAITHLIWKWSIKLIELINIIYENCTIVRNPCRSHFHEKTFWKERSNHLD